MLRKIRANQIVAKALKTRKKYLSVSSSTPICPYNLADAMGFDVRFVKINSFEGMYLADEGVILISAERPEGRKAFTCAHELGHHILGHGTIIDEIIEFGSDKEIEKEADFFASMLLMPSSVVKRATNDIGASFQNLSNEQVYILSKYLGVSYLALVNQMHFSLNLIDRNSYDRLKRGKLPQVKQNLLQKKTDAEVFIVGNWWRERAIDISVGDHLIFDGIITIEGSSLEGSGGAERIVYQAIKPGITKVSNNNGWSAFVRVSKRKFVGMYQYMHEEDVE